MAKFRYHDPEEDKRDPFAQEDASASSEFEQLLAAKGDEASVTTRRYKQGEQITGTVIRVGQDFLFIDLGGKSTASLAVEEYLGSNETPPKVGEELKAFVREDNGSEVILTRALRRGETDVGVLRDAFENELRVEGKVEKHNKGGFDVSVGGKRAFCPMGHMDSGSIDNPDSYIGLVLKFNVIEFKQGGRNIVLSRRQLLREEQKSKAQEVMRTLEPGQTLRAVISRIAEFGAFADLGGVDGLIPMSELSWKRVKSAEEVVKVGQVVMVKVLKVEHAPRLRISLSLKEAGEDPWAGLATRLVPGSKVQGIITRLTEFGAFVSVEDTVEGLAHISQLTWEKRLNHPAEAVKVGQQVEATVLSCDLEARKLSLSLKGEMPSGLAEKLAAKRRGGEASPEDTQALADWENYQKTVQKAQKEAGLGGTQSALAAAFQSAGKKKGK